MGDLVSLVLQPLDGLGYGSAPHRLGLEQVDLQLGGFDAEVGDGAEQIEEFLVAGEKAHGRTLGDEG
jgi:hypothetical protein